MNLSTKWGGGQNYDNVFYEWSLNQAAKDPGYDPPNAIHLLSVKLCVVFITLMKLAKSAKAFMKIASLLFWLAIQFSGMDTEIVTFSFLYYGNETAILWDLWNLVGIISEKCR